METSGGGDLVQCSSANERATEMEEQCEFGNRVRLRHGN
jgi:hypothetical protein